LSPDGEAFAEGDALADGDALAEAVASGDADAVADGEARRLGLGVTVAVGDGLISKVSWYFPLNQTKYAANRTIIKIITTIVTFLLIG